MDGLTGAAASGLRARMEALDMLANNIANASTAGFKRDGEFYSIFTDAEAAAENQCDIGMMPLVEKHWTDFAQGTLATTGRPLDLALSGRGFFVLNGPSGALYTRNGSFQVDSTGRVTTSEGFGLRLVGGTPLQLQPSLPVEIATDGTVSQGGAALGRLEVVDIPVEQLNKQGDTLFRAAAGAVPATVSAEVHQGKLENSNVGSAESAVRLVTLMRTFEMLQKAITVGSEINRKSVEELARVGS
jgi:flagellar basal-body rod protein FlgF